MSRPPLCRHPRPLRTAAAVIVTSTALVLTSCGRAHNATPTAASSSYAAAAPAANKTVASATWNLPGEPVSLDPVKVFSGTDMWVSSNVCESLLTFTPDGTLKPGLATSVDAPNSTTYVIHLRPNVSFSDGTPMTASDVAFSLNRVMDPKSGSYWSQFATRVVKVAATGDHTVTITMQQPDAVFYRMLGTPLGQVVSKAAAQKAGAAFGSAQGGIVCTGPYTMQSWQKGNSITLAANDHWWNAGRQPLLARQVKFTFLSDENTLASALANGDIDGSFTVPQGAALTKLSHAKNGQLYLGPSTNQTVLVPTKLMGDGPLANPLVRQALADSIDYTGIIASIYGPTAQPLRAIVPPGAFGYAKDTFQQGYDALPERQHDNAAAKKLLAQAGDPHPSFTLAIPSSSAEYISLGEAIQSNAKDAGINVTIKSLSNADYYPLFSSTAARAKVDAFLTDWFVDIPDPLELYAQIGTPGSPDDFGGLKDSRVTALLNQAVATPDDEQRAKLTVEAQKSITQLNVWLPISYGLGTMFLNNRLGGVSAADPYSFYAPWLATLGGR